MHKCSNPNCPYDLEAYGDRPEHHGLCLNCLDDERCDIEMMKIELAYDDDDDWRFYDA
jgi:hypothetical protein